MDLVWIVDVDVDVGSGIVLAVGMVGTCVSVPSLKNVMNVHIEGLSWGFCWPILGEFGA